LGKVFKGLERATALREGGCLFKHGQLSKDITFLDIVLAKMPSYKNIDSYLDRIEKDKIPVLGLTVGKHSDVTPGVKIPKAGRSPFSHQNPCT
jgi:hypothetical protein